MRILYLLMGIALMLIISISFVYHKPVNNFYGIADTREIAINYHNSVEIRKIHVVQGQNIKEGDLLLDLDRPELSLQISEMTRKLDEVRMQRQMTVSKISSQLKQLEAQYELNKKSISELKSISTNDIVSGNDMANPLKVEIDNLKRELRLASSAGQTATSRNISGNADTSAKKLVAIMESELKLLEAEKKKLQVCSPIDGIIGSVDFKEGEKVSPFVPIVTLHTKTPSYVKGYIHENVYNTITTGQKVLVASTGDRKTSMEGTVIGVGARIVEYPVRLRKIPEMQMWGREVMIKIPEQNKFMLGEKLLIRISKPDIFSLSFFR